MQLLPLSNAHTYTLTHSHLLLHSPTHTSLLVRFTPHPPHTPFPLTSTHCESNALFPSHLIHPHTLYPRIFFSTRPLSLSLSPSSRSLSHSHSSITTASHLSSCGQYFISCLTVLTLKLPKPFPFPFSTYSGALSHPRISLSLSRTHAQPLHFHISHPPSTKCLNFLSFLRFHFYFVSSLLKITLLSLSLCFLPSS